MIADIFVRHGFFWATQPKKNPIVGRRVPYRSFENQRVKDFLRSEFGIPLGEMVSYDDDQQTRFADLVRAEYPADERNVWKGAVEFFPLWWSLHCAGAIEAFPMIVLRNKAEVIASVVAKHGGRNSAQKLVDAQRITDLRFDILERLATDHAFPVILTSDIIRGDITSLREAFEYIQEPFETKIAADVVDPAKWEADR